jgi:hypothetical protein
MLVWGIPKSKGGIVIRKAFRLMLCISFSIAILAACVAPTPMPTVTPICADITHRQSANLHRIDLAQAAWAFQLWFIAALLLLAPALRRN